MAGDNEKQTPNTQSLCGSLRRDGHWKCLGLTLMITGCLATIIWCQLDSTDKPVLTYLEVSFSSSDRSGPCKRGYIYIPVACAVMLYLVYLVECWHSHAWLELRYKCDIASVYDTINQMQQSLPVIWWKATCYHYVRRTRQVTRYRNGDAFTSSQVYYERVNSNTAGAAFNFTRCGVKDISRPLSDLEKYPAIKIKISKGFSFANLDTEFEFEQQRSQFFQEYETKDDYMEGREGMDLINVHFKEYIIAFRDPNNLPWYVSHIVFWIASLILLSWPLRAIIEFKTAHLHYHIHKLFGCHYLDSENYPGLISRVSTMNSSEFEMSIRNNNVIVPSYSEAVLTDTQEQMLLRDYGTIKTHPFKFPRSLTNVTLSGKSSKRSGTPTVTMNQVKRFKSCNVFGKSEPTASSQDYGTVRHHMQQLVRGRTQGSMTAVSQYSISGLSLGNDSVRFHNISSTSPDDVTDSFSYHPAASTRTHDTCSESIANFSEATSRKTETCSKSSNLQKVSKTRPRQFDSQFSVLNRSMSVPCPDQCGQETIDHLPTDCNQGLPLEFISTAKNHNPAQNTHQSLLLPANDVNNCGPFTASSPTTPSTPSSPPDYEEAIKMRHLVSPLVFSTGLNSLNQSSGIRLTRNSSDERTRSKMSVTGEGSFPVGEGSISLVLDNQPIDLRINTGPSVDHFQSTCDISSLDNSRLQSVSSSEGNKYYPSHPNHYHNKHEQQTSASAIFKALPKVNKINCAESDDSESGCLHNTTSEVKELGNAQTTNDYLSNRTSHPRSFGIGSSFGLEVTLSAQDGTSEMPASTNQRSVPSTSVSTSAVVLIEGSRLQSPSRNRMETSV